MKIQDLVDVSGYSYIKDGFSEADLGDDVGLIFLQKKGWQIKQVVFDAINREPVFLIEKEVDND